MVGYFGTISHQSSKIPACEESKICKTEPIGIPILLVGYLLMGFRYISEEKLLQGYDIEPLQQVGYEGFWGLLIQSVIVLPIATLIRCSDSACTSTGYREDIGLALEEY